MLIQEHVALGEIRFCVQDKKITSANVNHRPYFTQIRQPLLWNLFKTIPREPRVNYCSLPVWPTNWLLFYLQSTSLHQW